MRCKPQVGYAEGAAPGEFQHRLGDWLANIATEHDGYEQYNPDSSSKAANDGDRHSGIAESQRRLRTPLLNGVSHAVESIDGIGRFVHDTDGAVA